MIKREIKITEIDNGFILEIFNGSDDDTVIRVQEGKEKALANCIFELVDEIFRDTLSVKFEIKGQDDG